ncbi:hypothetical protein KUH32_02665 [Thalassococcus sp. CAU 1522]|uniref:Uncharacterized protein n=1 Tax=Thalassococcus arenae TaxID=2851652 RepID=A0ABS6N3R1_9RHOB|nr:hypothetical protein [Thalassococcus arenae]MBV2358662.1 hypothetical protein [Thalassococcus arenae]
MPGSRIGFRHAADDPEAAAMKLFDITRWPAFLVFVLAGGMAASFAFVTVNLFSQAMRSVEFLQTFGREAIRHGALWQVGELSVWGGLALSCWLVFKICEHDLTNRYFDWARKRPRRAPGQRAEGKGLED